MVPLELLERIAGPGRFDAARGILPLAGREYRFDEATGMLARADRARAAGGHYAESFGLEWQHFRYVQADSALGTPKTENRLRRLMNRPLEDLAGKTVLEVGPGGGRFTEILTQYARDVICLEPSEAASLNIAWPRPNMVVVNEGLESNPIPPGLVDVVVCRGVIQHTPDPMQFIDSLFRSVKPQGWVFFDFYKTTRWYLSPKTWLRPVTRRIDPKTMLRWCLDYVPGLTRRRWRWEDRGVPVRITSRLIPIVDNRRQFGFTTDQQIIDANVLDTFDMYTPRYDHPPTTKRVLAYLRAEGLQFLSEPNLDENFFRVVNSR